MGRVYTGTFKNVTISAAQDLLSAKGHATAGKTFKLRRVWLYMNDTTLQTAQGLRLNVKFTPATFTVGSGGSAVTPIPVDAGDAAAAFSMRKNDTTPGTGTMVDIMPVGGHNYAGFDYTWPKGEEVVFGLLQGVVFELLSTVSGTCAFSAGMTIEEQGL